MLGRRLPLRASVQRRYVLSDPTGPDHISVRLITGVSLRWLNSLLPTVDGIPVEYSPKRKWLGVIAFKSHGSALTDVKRRELRAISTRQKVVCSTSSVRRCVPRIVYNTRLKLRTNLSQLPPWCGALGGLNLHFIPLWASSAAMLTTFHFSLLSRSSFCAPIKLVPLSDQIMAGVPLRDTNRSTPIAQELVSMDLTISTWTARVVRQVKRKPHFLSVVRWTIS